MAHEVFISYSSRDKAIADAVCAGLEAAKIRCWIAPRDVLPGVPYGEALGEALQHSQILLLVFSSNSNRSAQVMREVESAVDKGIPILPFRIEDVMPTASLDYFVKAIHWLDAITPPLEQHLESLVESVQSLLARRHPGTAAPAATSGATPVRGAAMPKKRGKLGLLLAGVGSFVAVLAIAVGLTVWWLRDPNAGRESPNNPTGSSQVKPETLVSPEKTQALAARAEADKVRLAAEQGGAKEHTPTLWAQAESKNADAVRHFDAGDLALAKQSWSAARVAYGKVNTALAALPGAQKAQSAFEAELAKGDRKSLEADGGDIWQRIDTLTKSAEDCRKQERFADAASKYDEALRLLPDAKYAAARLHAKYDAYNTGADVYTWFMWSNMAYVSKKSLKDKTAKDPASAQKMVDDSLAIVEQCLPGLRANMKRMQLPEEFCTEMMRGKDLTSQELVVWRGTLYDKIKEKWGDEVAKSYSVGSMLSGLGLILATANVPGGSPPDVQNVLTNLRDAGVGAGYPQDFFDALDKIDSQCRAGNAKQAQSSYQVFADRMGLPAAAKALLRQPAGAPLKK